MERSLYLSTLFIRINRQNLYMFSSLTVFFFCYLDVLCDGYNNFEGFSYFCYSFIVE